MARGKSNAMLQLRSYTYTYKCEMCGKKEEHIVRKRNNKKRFCDECKYKRQYERKY